MILKFFVARDQLLLLVPRPSWAIVWTGVCDQGLDCSTCKSPPTSSHSHTGLCPIQQGKTLITYLDVPAMPNSCKMF